MRMRRTTSREGRDSYSLKGLGGRNLGNGFMVKKAKSFDPEIFLATVNHGRALSEFRTGRVVFSQGDAADSVFYTPSHRGSAKVVAWRGILDSSSGDDSGRLSVGERTGGP